MANKELELALRLRADLAQGKAALDQVSESVQAVGDKAEQAGRKLSSVGESADQQTARIRAMVAASLQQQSAQDAAAASTQRLNAAVQAGNTAWRDSAQAQSTAMNAYHNAERARVQQAATEQRAAEAAAKAAAETAKQDAAARKLLGAIDPTQRSLARLAEQERQLTEHFRAGRVEANAYASALNRIKAQRDVLTGVGNEAKASTLALIGMGAAIRRVQGLLFAGIAGYGLASFSKEIVNTNLQWQQALYTMEAATGSAAKARQELEYVREISERLGLELLNTSQAYSRLVAAAKETPELGSSLRTIFEGVASATTALHLTRQETNGILLALEQMVSKGKVQTQELVLQLGQRVPGAFSLAAKALGTNTKQLSEWLEKGMIPAAEFLPRFGAALQEAYGPASQKAATGLQAELNRLENAFTDLKIQAGESGFIDTFTQAVRDLRDVLKDPAVVEGLNLLIKGLGTAIGYAAKGAAGVVNVTKFVAEEIAARVNGPAGDDVPRLDDAIARETEYMARVQSALDEAYEKNDQKRIQRYEEALSKAQAQIQQWQDQRDAVLNGAGQVAALPATTVTGTGPTTKTPFTPSGGEDKAAARLAKQNEDWVKQLEKEAATYGKGRAALREYELDQRNLTGALEARARAAWATLDAAEKQKKADEQAKKDATTLKQLNLDYLRATGQTVEAAGAEIEKKYGDLQKRLLATGDTEGAGLVSKLMGIEKAKAELQQIQDQVDRIFGEQSRQESSIQAAQQAGLVSELAARQQLLDLHRSTADEVEQLVPRMEELAKATGDPAAIERVKDLRQQLENTRVAADQLTLALRSGIENGMQDALRGLADGTLSLQEAAVSLLQAVSRSLADVAAQQLAQKATAGLMSLFGQGEQDTSMVTGAAAVTSAAGALAAAGGTLVTGAAALQSAAGSLALANGVKGAGVAASGAGAAGAAAGGSGWWSSITSMFGFADGGQVRGPGTPTSDSIPAWLSDQEVVIRAAAATQPGMTPLLLDINKRGWAALHDWSGAVRHATGGIASIPAPAMPAPGLSASRLQEPAKNLSATLKNNQNFYLVDDPSRIGDVMAGRYGDEAMVLHISRDPQKFRQLLGIN
ncbi:tape measure protein [Pseudomonas aeruginosa]|uniref:tape measure protein n=1 Tax=Pseudomonas aeruginosa TaxID=287 RepID=UPI0021B08A75|nr:tape measure protein [Pseudomonas aeruginosa]MCT5586710.1 tape measure protein [Pseudomonas aeruginosa]WQE90034.1 tape measure protein [Pseudomonas aeruginosa]